MWHLVTRGNIQKFVTFPRQSSIHLRAHAAPSGECNYCVCVCVLCVCVCVCVCTVALEVTLCDDVDVTMSM